MDAVQYEHMRTGLLIAFGIIIGSTLSTFVALAWTAPTSTPPGGNVSSPVNVGGTMQLKNGTLGVNGLGVFGDTILSGSGTDGTPPAYLNFGSTAGTNGYGIRNNAGTLEFKNLSGSWGSLNVTLTNLMQVNGITPNGLGQITSIKFGDGTTQTTAGGTGVWATNGSNIYNTNAGNVGIGISAPAASLHVYSATNAVSGLTDWGTNIQVETPGTATHQLSQINLVTKGDQMLLGTTATNLGWSMFARGNAYGATGEVPNSFGISYWNGSAWIGNNYFRILSNGNIGIGTITPHMPLQVGSELSFYGFWPGVFFNTYFDPNTSLTKYVNNGAGAIIEEDMNNNVLGIYAGPVAAAGANFYSSGGIETVFIKNIGGTGYVGIDTVPSYPLDVWGTARFTGGYTTSDRRLKQDIAPLPSSSVEQLLALRPVMFHWINPAYGTTTQYGFIAQDVQQVFPNLVSADNKGILSVNYTALFAPMVNAVREVVTVTGTFRQNIVAWLGSAGNGITDLYASVIHSHQVQADEADVQKLCIGSGTTKTCITQQQLAALLANQATRNTQ